jgi:hypothetical protein
VSDPRWYELRPAQSMKPATYTCPYCGELLHAAAEHALVKPEGDARRRRHAHLECVRTERAAGRLPTRDEWIGVGGSGRGVRGLWRRLRSWPG